MKFGGAVNHFVYLCNNFPSDFARFFKCRRKGTKQFNKQCNGSKEDVKQVENKTIGKIDDGLNRAFNDFA